MIFHRTAATFALIFAVLAGPACAQSEVDDAAHAYVAATGFEVMPIDRIEGALNDLIGADPAAMVPADAEISPIEKAFLLLGTQEVPLPRVRYVLRYNQAAVDGIALSLIDIERYNLGPTIREDTALTYGAKNTAGPKAFGIGPHVAWRFVTQPTSKTAALLLGASRREIDDREAATRSCLPRLCLSLDLLDGLAAWNEGISSEANLVDVAYGAFGPSEFAPNAREIVPAYRALELAVAAGIADIDDIGVRWSIPTRQGGKSASPILVVLLDQNLGQEIGLDAALGVAKLGLAGKEQWTRISSGYVEGGATEILHRADGPLVPEK